ncbi:hypothetical protein [uncultured Photobacterium sp.]|uniref:hypothetical protein n=1 Tax=uncultured Photobacterium sp. TaxID=173973 RepID=UPI002614B7B1|nr:hypothetical protein [uncultured Photobacterium sp.]
MHKTKKQLLSSALLSFLLVGCGEGSGAVDNGPKVDNQVVVNMEFAATYLQNLGSDALQSAVYSQAAVIDFITDDEANVDRNYHGQVKVTNTKSGEEQLFDLSATQKTDGKVVSQQTLPLKPGCYDVDLVLTLDGKGKELQYVSKTKGQEIIEGRLAELDFVLSPSFGESIVDLSNVQSLPSLMLDLLPEEIAALSQPQFGLSINGGEEKVFTINKELGIVPILLNLDSGYHRLTMYLYDANKVIGKSDKTVNITKDTCTKMVLVPLQSSVNWSLTEFKDQGTFTFIIPDEVVNEVGSAQNLALIVRLAGDKEPVQERVLIVRYDNGFYKARELFETKQLDNVDVYLAFHRVSEASEGFHLTPFASCNMAINFGLNPKVECELELKRERIKTDHGLGTLVLNVLDKELLPVKGKKVFVDGKLAGLTGNKYSTGLLKADLFAGEHEIRVFDGINEVVGSVIVEPQAVQNQVLYL